jgi:serine/threonine-protein kinase HipA
MSPALVVSIGPRVAGTLTRRPGGRIAFEYDPAYQVRRDATPLSVSMPLPVRVHGHAAISAWLWGLLPENPAVLERWARRFHTSISPFGLLGTPIGEDCPGAVRILAPERVEALERADGPIEWLTEDDVAERLRELHDDGTTWLGSTFTGRFSLAGAQAKTALLHRDGRWGLPSGAIPTTHILKPATQGLDEHDLNEHLCLDAARRAGLVAARTRIHRFSDEPAVVVERYDRLASGADVTRIHQEDVCQALGFEPARKYQNEGGPTPAAVAGLFRATMSPAVADEAIARFADALAWNWLIAGTDAHAKNYSLLLAGGEVRFAPLYDVGSALPYGVHERRLRFAMYPQRYGWPAAAAELGLDATAVVDRVRDLAAAAPDAFADAARSLGSVVTSTLPDRLTALVSERVARCLGVVTAAATTTRGPQARPDP